MDRGKRPNKLVGSRNSKIYMDLRDIIREHTLPFLPAKSLFRFQGVCRDWKLQISTPFFAHNQSLTFQAISGLFCQSSGGDPPSFISIDPQSCGVPDPSLKFLPEPIDIRASSNGLICCQGQTGDKPYYICNPVTRQLKKLPKTNADHGLDPAVVLVFEPSLLNFVADYKLVCAFPSVDFDNATEFEIYSSTDGSWKISEEICFASKKLVPRSGIYVDDAVDGVGFHERGDLWNWSGLPTAISLYTFCYCGHAVFPTLCNSMKDRGQFPMVLLVCFVLSTICYGSMAVLGYLMFGENLMSQVTLNLPTHNISSKIAIYTTLINPITKYAIIISPIATAIEDTSPFRNSRSISLLIRSVLVFSTVVVALSIPFFGYVMAFIGSFLSVSVSILLPCLCYLKIYKAYRSFGAELMLIGAILVMGVFVAVTGTYTSLREIVKHLKSV